MCEVCICGEKAAVIKQERSRRRFGVDVAVNGVALSLRCGEPVTLQALDRAAAAIKELEDFDRRAAASL